MQRTIKELEAAMLSLPAEERVRLVESLLASLEPEPAVLETWLMVARKRRDEVRAGAVEMIHGNEALARVRQRLK